MKGKKKKFYSQFKRDFNVVDQWRGMKRVFFALKAYKKLQIAVHESFNPILVGTY